MPDTKVRRWIDLLTALLRRHYGITFSELIEEVPAYLNHRGSAAALRRAFERDKQELRAAGIPIATLKGESESLELYSLRRADFYLPYLTLLSEGRKSRPGRVDRDGYRALGEISFDPDGLALIREAAIRAGQLGDPQLADQARSAIRTLSFDLPLHDAEPDPLRLAPSPDKIPEKLFESIDRALCARKAVTFEYRSMGDETTRRRTVHPYGLFYLSHHWYLAAAEPGERVVKNFRLSRMESFRVNGRKPGTPDFSVPQGFDLRAHARSRRAWELGSGDGEMALVEFRGESGPARAAWRLGLAVEGAPDRRRFVMRRRDALARWLLSFGGELVPLEPPALVSEFHQLVAQTLAGYGAADA